MQVPPAQNRPRELKISGSPCFYAKNVWFHFGKDPFLFLLSPYPIRFGGFEIFEIFPVHNIAVLVKCRLPTRPEVLYLIYIFIFEKYYFSGLTLQITFCRQNLFTENALQTPIIFKMAWQFWI